LQAFIGSVKERRALEFFFHWTAPQLSGFFSSSFWNGSVLQFSMNEPAIRHAMIAVSAMYEDESLVGQSPCAGTEAHQVFALQSYNKAIHSLLQTAEANPDSVRIPVMAAIIFICLEFLRGNVDAAITHIESGVKMLTSWRTRHGNLHDTRSLSALPAEAAFIEEQLVPMFGWLNMLSSLFGRPSLPIYSSLTDSHGTLLPRKSAQTIDEARFILLDLVNASVKFIQSIGQTKYQSEVTVDMIAEQVRLTTLLHQWSDNFDILSKRADVDQTERRQRGLNLLRAMGLTIRVWLNAALFPNETSWDLYKWEYEEIVRLTGTLIAVSASVPDEASKRFSFEMGIIPQLHFVAWKCRWPHIRRKALSLLLASPRRECLFESHRSYTVFSRVMKVEEECFNLPPGSVPGENELPPEKFRVHQVDIGVAPPTSAGSPMNFLLKPQGLDGPWHSRTEYIHIGWHIEFENSIATYPWIVGHPYSEEKFDITNELTDMNVFQSEESVDESEHSMTGLWVSGSQAILSVGRFKPHEPTEPIDADYTRRKRVFSSQSGVGDPERARQLSASIKGTNLADTIRLTSAGAPQSSELREEPFYTATGFSVNGSQKLLSIGRFNPYETLEPIDANLTESSDFGSYVEDASPTALSSSRFSTLTDGNV
jgi:hypothetical protein